MADNKTHGNSLEQRLADTIDRASQLGGLLANTDQKSAEFYLASLDAFLANQNATFTKYESKTGPICKMGKTYTTEQVLAMDAYEFIDVHKKIRADEAKDARSYIRFVGRYLDRKNQESKAPIKVKDCILIPFNQAIKEVDYLSKEKYFSAFKFFKENYNLNLGLSYHSP